MWFQDTKGNLSDKGSDSIIYDATSPSSTSLSVDTGNIATNSQIVTLSLTASDAVGVTGHYSSESATTPDLSDSGWTSVSSATTYSGTANFTMSSGEGTKTVYAWFRDFAGNISVANNDTIILDQSAPSGSVSINSGASSTNSSSVTLTLTVTDGIGVTGYYVSNSSSTPTISTSGWTSISSTTSYSGSLSHTLGSGCNPYVYVWFRDSGGNISATSSDTITSVSSTTSLSGSWSNSGGQSYTSSGNPRYNLIVSNTGWVTINLISSTVDTVLYLLYSSGSLKSSNDDGGTGTNSRIYNYLSSGTYIIVPATYSYGETANFTLSVSGGSICE